MKKFLAMAALAGLAGLTACSVSTPAPDAPSQVPATPQPSQANSPRATGSAAGGTDAPPSSAAGEDSAGGAKGACELFNRMFADYKAIPADDPNGFEDIYLQAEDAKDAAAGGLRGLFASLSLLAIDHSAAAESGGVPAQESKDAVRDAVFANSRTCTAEGVTLRL